MTVSGFVVIFKVCPLWPFCPPTFLPDVCRRLFGAGFLYPSDDGGMELFREFLFNCSCSSPCSLAKYGRTCSVPLDSNIRLYNSPPRGSKEWKETYNGRTSAERCNKRMKLDYLLEDAHHHTSKFWYIRVYLIMMVLHLDAWSSLTEI